MQIQTPFASSVPLERGRKGQAVRLNSASDNSPFSSDTIIDTAFISWEATHGMHLAQCLTYNQRSTTDEYCQCIFRSYFSCKVLEYHLRGLIFSHSCQILWEIQKKELKWLFISLPAHSQLHILTIIYIVCLCSLPYRNNDERFVVIELFLKKIIIYVLPIIFCIQNPIC